MPANPSMPSANIGKLFATKVSPIPNGINASPNAPMATAPDNIKGNGTINFQEPIFIILNRYGLIYKSYTNVNIIFQNIHILISMSYS
mgnify:CR=1 FL=1